MGSGVSKSQSFQSSSMFHPPSPEYLKKLLSLQVITKDSKFESHVSSISEEEASSFSKISTFLLKEGKTENEKCFLAYIFVKTRISFDEEFYFQIPVQPEIRVLENLLKERKALSWGFAAIYQRICQLMGIQCHIVFGFSKLFFRTNVDFKTPNHWWNVVNIQNDWFIVDASCASYYASLENNWYLMAPEISIYNQFSVKNWNLIKENIQLEQFLDLPCLGAKYFEFDCLLPKSFFKYRYKTADSLSIKFNIDHNKYNIKCSLMSQSNVNNLSDRTFIANLSSNFIELKAVFPSKGFYEFRLDACLKNPADSLYFHIFSALIEYDGVENKYLSFPYCNNFDLVVHEPKSHYVEKQTLVKYDVSSLLKITQIAVSHYPNNNQLKLIDEEKNRFAGEIYFSSHNDDHVLIVTYADGNTIGVKFEGIETNGPKILTQEQINYLERVSIKQFFEKLKCEVISPKDPIFSDSIYKLQFSCKQNVDIFVKIQSLEPAISDPPSFCSKATYINDFFEIKFAPLHPGKYTLLFYLTDKDDSSTYWGSEPAYSLDLEYIGSPQRIGFPYVSDAIEGGVMIEEPLNGFIKVGMVKFKVSAPKALKISVVECDECVYLVKEEDWYVGEVEIKRADVYIDVKVHINQENDDDCLILSRYLSYKEEDQGKELLK